MGINKAILVGHVGKDPEVMNTQNNNKVAKFSFATTETYKNKQGEKVTNTEWHNIVIWGNLAGVVEQYVKKGSQLYLEGKIVTRSYEKDGQKRYSTEIVVNQLEMLGGKTEQKEQTNEPQKHKIDYENSGLEEDDLPF